MTPRRHGLGCLHQPSRGDNALLNDHAEDERRLPTGDRPVRSADRSYVRTNAWNSHAEDLVLPRANRVSSHPDDLVGPAAMGDRDMDHVVVEVLESLSLESRDTVEGGDSAPHLPDGSPTQRLGGQVARVHGYRLVTVETPTPGIHLVADVMTVDLHGSQHRSREDSAVIRGGLSRPLASGFGHHTISHLRRMRSMSGAEPATQTDLWTV